MGAIRKFAVIFTVTSLCGAVVAETVDAGADLAAADTVVWGSPSSHPPGPRSVPRVARQGSAQIEPLEMNVLPCGCSILRGKHRHFPKLRTSVGLGFYFDGDFGGGIEWPEAGERIRMPYNGGGAYLFFDAQYLEINLGHSSGGSVWKSGGVPAGDLPVMARSFFGFGLMAKYPVVVGALPQNMRVYPMAGINYVGSHSALLRPASGGDYVFDGGEEFGGVRRPRGGDLSALWFKFGGGGEYFLGGGTYVRSELLYGVRGSNAYERRGVAGQRGEYPSARVLRGHGLNVRVGVGVDLNTVKSFGGMSSM